ncbi:MAG: NUDIX domain-containing protein [Elainellaceae cyanobacterium]
MSRHSTDLAECPTAVTVGVESVIFAVDIVRGHLLVLLITQQSRGCQPLWSLPRTLVYVGESLEAAAYRVLSAKIHADNLYLEQLYTFDDFNDSGSEDKAIALRQPTLSVSYFALVRIAEARLIDDDPNCIQWCPFDQVPNLAFNHNKILSYGYRRLRNKLEYSPVAFDVLPQTFTLGDLYQLYSTVLGEQFSDYSNFRARLLKLGFLTNTGLKASRGAGRPASLYRFDPEKFAPLKDKPLVFV